MPLLVTLLLVLGERAEEAVTALLRVTAWVALPQPVPLLEPVGYTQVLGLCVALERGEKESCREREGEGVFEGVEEGRGESVTDTLPSGDDDTLPLAEGEGDADLLPPRPLTDFRGLREADVEPVPAPAVAVTLAVGRRPVAVGEAVPPTPLAETLTVLLALPRTLALRVPEPVSLLNMVLEEATVALPSAVALSVPAALLPLGVAESCAEALRVPAPTVRVTEELAERDALSVLLALPRGEEDTVGVASPRGLPVGRGLLGEALAERVDDLEAEAVLQEVGDRVGVLVGLPWPVAVVVMTGVEVPFPLDTVPRDETEGEEEALAGEEGVRVADCVTLVLGARELDKELLSVPVTETRGLSLRLALGLRTALSEVSGVMVRGGRVALSVPPAPEEAVAQCEADALLLEQ